MSTLETFLKLKHQEAQSAKCSRIASLEEALEALQEKYDKAVAGLKDNPCTCRVDDLPPSKWDCVRCETLKELGEL